MTDPREPGAAAEEEPLSPSELRTFETRLRHSLADLRDDVAESEDLLLATSADDRGQQPDDEGLEEEALHVERARLSVGDELGYEVREALQRIRDGTYGRCTSCGTRIARERLEIVPHAPLCAACAARSG